jgi:hypothetical protein
MIFKKLLISVAVAIVTISCGQMTIVTEPTLSPSDILLNVASNIETLEATKFALSHSEGGTELLPGILLTDVQGLVQFPNRAEFAVSATLGNMLMETTVIIVEDSAHMTDFLSGQWQEIPADMLPIRILNLKEMLLGIVSSLSDVTFSESMPDDSDSFYIDGTNASDIINTFIVGTDPGNDILIGLVIDKGTNMISEITISGRLIPSDTSNMLRKLTLSDAPAAANISAPN